MFVGPETLSLLARLGVTGDEAVAVIRAFERDMEAQNVPRTANAERQARHRAKKKAASVTPSVTSNVTNNATGNGQDNAFVTPPRARVRDITSNQEISGKITSETKVSSVRMITIAKPNGFARFWEAYPSKVAKRTAEQAYLKALKRISGPDPPGVILAGVARAKLSRKWREGFVQNPATWLNGDGWEDELETEKPPNERPDPKFVTRHQNFADSFAGAQSAARNRAIERARG